MDAGGTLRERFDAAAAKYGWSKSCLAAMIDASARDAVAASPLAAEPSPAPAPLPEAPKRKGG